MIVSPNGKLSAQIALTPEGAPTWTGFFGGKPVIGPSNLGLNLLDAPALTGGFAVASTKRDSKDQTYTLPVGKTSKARDHYNELVLTLQETSGSRRQLQVIFRAYDDAITFRYGIPQQPGIQTVHITGEATNFAFPQDSKCWALKLKSFRTPYEANYEPTSVSLVAPGSFIGLPFTVQPRKDLTMLIAEAHLKDWAGMYLDSPTTGSNTLISKLPPLPSMPAACVETTAPAVSPWRVVLMVDQPGKLIESTTILNLNDPCAIADTSWIKPGKTAWDWWSGPIAPGQNFEAGTNNETVKYFIDFASAMGLQYMLIDEGWYAPKNSRKKGQFDFDLTKTIPEIDMPMLVDYAKQRKVDLIVWMHWITTSRQMDTAFPLFEKWGLKGVKVDFMDRDDQEMVGFYHRIIDTAAKYHLLIDLHGAYKPTGLQRTYPNFITQEGVMGAEHNKWSANVTPTYNLTLPFTRMVPGPMDYTPGGFNNVQPSQFEKRSTGPMVMATRAAELAKYVVYESELQMLADYPGAYLGQPGAEFLKVVPANWDETRVLQGEIGEYIVMARRAGKRWFVGAMTNESPRKLSVPLDSLGIKAGKMTEFSDGPNAAQNAKDLTTGTAEFNPGKPLELNLAPSGGFAAVIE